jgi:hypothetical protein
MDSSKLRSMLSLIYYGLKQVKMYAASNLLQHKGNISVYKLHSYGVHPVVWRTCKLCKQYMFLPALATVVFLIILFSQNVSASMGHPQVST